MSDWAQTERSYAQHLAQQSLLQPPRRPSWWARLRQLLTWLANVGIKTPER